jgi:hypothetical protein
MVPRGNTLFAVPRSLPAALLAALALAGCGAQKHDAGVARFKGEQRRVAQVVADLGTSADSRDTAAICGRLLARSLVDRIAAGPLDCEQEIKKSLEDADGFDLTVQRVTVVGPNVATALVSDKQRRTSTLALVREGRGWRLASLG